MFWSERATRERDLNRACLAHVAAVLMHTNVRSCVCVCAFVACVRACAPHQFKWCVCARTANTQPSERLIQTNYAPVSV